MRSLLSIHLLPLTCALIAASCAGLRAAERTAHDGLAGTAWAWFGGGSISNDLAESAGVDGRLGGGVQVDLAPRSWPIRPAVGIALYESSDEVDDIKYDLTSTEITIGAQGYAWGPRTNRVEPGLLYGAGVVWVSSEIEGRADGESAAIDDEAVGAYAQLGLLARDRSGVVFGGLVRYAWAEASGSTTIGEGDDAVELGWDDEQLSGWTAALVVGWSW